MHERVKLAKLQSKTHQDPQYVDDSLKEQSNSSIQGIEDLSIHVGGSMNISDCSNESCTSISSCDSSSQTPGYLSANTPRKQKLVAEVKSGKTEIKNLKKTIVSLTQQLSDIDTVENYLRLSEKYLSPGLFTIVKSQINLKKKKKKKVIDIIMILNN